MVGAAARRLWRDLVPAGHLGDLVADEQDEVEAGCREADQALDAPAVRELALGSDGHGERDCRLAPVLIREVMTESVVTASGDRTVRQVAELMRERDVGSVVLVEDDRPTGFVTDRDLALSVIADGRDPGEPAADHASAPVIGAEPQMGVEEAADLMVRHAVRRLVVLDGGRLIGIVTLDDIASRIGDAALSQRLSARVTRAVVPDFFFHERGEG